MKMIKLINSSNEVKMNFYFYTIMVHTWYSRFLPSSPCLASRHKGGESFRLGLLGWQTAIHVQVIGIAVIYIHAIRTMLGWHCIMEPA